MKHGQAKRRDLRAAQTLVAVVKDDVLTGSRSSNRFVKFNANSNPVASVVDVLMLDWRQVADLQVWECGVTTENRLQPLQLEFFRV